MTTIGTSRTARIGPNPGGGLQDPRDLVLARLLRKVGLDLLLLLPKEVDLLIALRRAPSGAVRKPILDDLGELFVADFSGSSVTVHAGTAVGDVAPLRSVSGGGTGLFGPHGLATTEAAGGASGFAILVPEPDAGLMLGVALACCAAMRGSRHSSQRSNTDRS